jgi:DNA polymerase I-like protein with 3'-5' exonuclease and polymerase domains
MAITVGITTKESEQMQARWFAAHPGIKRWHLRTEQQLQRTRTIRNAFGYRRYYTGRIDNILPEALAWVPQSTVAVAINRGWDNIMQDFSTLRTEILLQVHDSLVGQYPTHLEKEILPSLHEELLITIPYPDPLTIPIGIKTSTRSWGECKDREWPHVA